MAFRASDMGGGNFETWYEASEEWQAGKQVYADPIVGGEIQHGLPFLVILVPFTWLDITEAQRAWLALSVLLLLHGVFMLSKMLRFDTQTPGRAVTRYAPWVALLLVAPFLHDFIRDRQTDVFVLWVMVLGIYMLGGRREPAAGCLLGVAGAFSLPFLALLPWLLYKQRFLAAVMFTVGLALTAALPMALPKQGLKKTLDHYAAYVELVRGDISSETRDPSHQSLPPLVRSSTAPGGILAGPESFANSQWIIRGLGGLLVFLCVFWIRPGRRGSVPDNSILVGEAGLVMALAVLLWPLAPLHYYSWLYPGAVFLVCTAMSRPKGNLLYAWPALVAFASLITVPYAASMGNWHDRHGFAAGLLLLVPLVGWTLRRENRLRAGNSGGRRGRL
jgi:hypothetical protein